MLDSPEDHDIGVLACMVNCSYKATSFKSKNPWEMPFKVIQEAREVSVLWRQCWMGREDNSSGPQWVKMKPMGMESQSSLLSVWPTAWQAQAAFVLTHASHWNQRDPSKMEKYWRDFDVSYKPWRDFKHVWHWYGTNCTKLQRSTGTKSCWQSPFEFVQPEPSNRDIFQQKNPHQHHTGVFSVFPLPPQKILV